MTKDIVQKLRKHLSSPIIKEPEVVYLLAEVRKLLEHDRPDPKPFALWMYCHWALHVKLTKTRTTLHFLERLDVFITHEIAGFTPHGDFSFLDSQNLFREFVFLDTFRQQLLDFLSSYDLPIEVCSDDGNWSVFMAAYAEVIKDGVLASESGNDGLRAVDSGTLNLKTRELVESGLKRRRISR
jgi:hypothetical protein